MRKCPIECRLIPECASGGWAPFDGCREVATVMVVSRKSNRGHVANLRQYLDERERSASLPYVGLAYWSTLVALGPRGSLSVHAPEDQLMARSDFSSGNFVT